MDPENKELMAVSTKAAVEGMTTAFIRELLGPVADLIDLSREPLRELLFKSQVKRVARAKALLEEQGIPVASVSLKFLVPWATGASLDDLDDNEMTERWAALLANAAAGDGRGAGVLPSFPGILAELSPQEAVMLDAIYERTEPAAEVPTVPGRAVQTLKTDLGMADDPLFETRLSNLDRLALCLADYKSDYNSMSGTSPVNKDSFLPYWVRPTPLGLSFVAACAPPK
jgi:hypothetical protein